MLSPPCPPTRRPWSLGNECRQIRVDKDLRLDLTRMVNAARGAGMVYVCNPNNPTATIDSAPVIESVVADVQRAASEALVLIGEAYHDYVTDPAYATIIPLAMRRKNVLVARTFSKAYGMAGLCGSSGPESRSSLRSWRALTSRHPPSWVRKPSSP
jgi:histidinol-phosphate aminotransferase